MTQITLGSCEPRTLLSHMALYGLGAILEAEGTRDVRIGWTESANPRPYVVADSPDTITVADLVRRHAEMRNAASSWLRADLPLSGTSRGLMSPRLALFGDNGTWARVQDARHEALDTVTDGSQWLDLRFIAALGEPCYWSHNRKGDTLQDDGASRWEMQPRNQGSEFVGTRLRKVAAMVAGRSPQDILAGLLGESVTDEAGSDRPDSRTATGLAGPGPTDNAIAWCALWGISQFPIAMRVNRTAVSSGHVSGLIRERRYEGFYVPMWRGGWRPARLRSVLASKPLRVMASSEFDAYPAADITASRAWLDARDVQGVIRFQVQKFGSGNAPERRAMRGELIPVQAAR